MIGKRRRPTANLRDQHGYFIKVRLLSFPGNEKYFGQDNRIDLILKKQESTVPVYHKSVSCNYSFISKPHKKYTLIGYTLHFDISYKLERELSLY